MNKHHLPLALLAALSLPGLVAQDEPPELTIVPGEEAAPEAAPEEQLTGDEAQALLVQLKALEEAIRGNTLKSRVGAAQALRSAGGSAKAAYAFFLKCKEEVDFTRNGLSSTQFRAVRDRMDDYYKENDHLMEALRFQIEYLVLSLRAAEAEEIATLHDDLRDYLGKIIRYAGTLKGAVEGNEIGRATDLDDLTTREKREIANRGGRGAPRSEVGGFFQILREDVTGTVYAKTYGLDKSLKLEGWSMAPGNFNAVFDETLLPHARFEKPESLGAVWDERIKYESYLKKVTMTPAAFNEFFRVQIPQLHFNKAKDILGFYSLKKGIAGMLKLINEHPSHPSSLKWIEEVRAAILAQFEEK